jgi:hypothetical protein
MSSQIFSTFSIVLLVVALNIRHLQPTLDQPWNMGAIQKPLSSLKKCSAKAL